MKIAVLRAAALIAAVCILLLTCACSGHIPDKPLPNVSDGSGLITNPSLLTEDTKIPGYIKDAPIISSGESQSAEESYSTGELYGSYLTMYLGHVPLEYRSLPNFVVFKSYQQISDYYDLTCNDYFYGVRFTLLLASFTDEFLAENDVLMLSINEPSSYVNHTAEPIEITDTEVRINLTRHIAQGAPLLDTEYRLLFIAPKGGFEGAEDKELKLTISEVIDQENNAAFDAESFRIYRPEYYNLCYRADSLTDSAEKVVDVIDGYEELVYFFDEYREKYDLDGKFRQHIGPLYNRQICDRYILLVTLIPCADENEPTTADLFINNLQIYMTINANEVKESEKPKACYLLLTAIERSELSGVDLSWMNLLVEPPEGG